MLFRETSSLILAPLRAHLGQGRIQTKVEWGGGNLERGRKNTMESERAEGARKFLGVFRENSVVYMLYVVYMFLHIQNESLIKEYIWVRIRGACLAKRGAKAEFSS